jgi:beta-lactamase regulating signal transducer with metallopeptidase domain
MEKDSEAKHKQNVIVLVDDTKERTNFEVFRDGLKYVIKFIVNLSLITLFILAILFVVQFFNSNNDTTNEFNNSLNSSLNDTNLIFNNLSENLSLTKNTILVFNASNCKLIEDLDKYWCVVS